MVDKVLPPSANWYCSKICDWGLSDALGLLVAFGAKNCVFLYRVAREGDAVSVSFVAQLVRGKRRVTAVQFLTDSNGDLRLVCGGEEGGVQIWDVASRTLIEQHRKHKAEVMAVTVSSALDANFVVAGDRQGRISAWERDAGKVSVFMPVSGDGIHSMAIAPHDKTLVAVGYRSGVLCLVDAAQGTIRHRLGGHDQEVQCVAWKSTVEAVGEGETGVIGSGEVWLASSSRDKTIKVWKIAAEEPALEQVLRLPTGKQGMSFTQTKQLWLPIAWSVAKSEMPAKHCLWSGSFDGSLFRWEWNVAKTEDQATTGKNRRSSCKPVVVKGGHSRMLFSIVMVPRASPLAEDALVSMLTVSLDRELRLWKESPVSKSVPAATCVEKLTGLGGHAYSISYSSATNLLAAGVGDQTIRLWSLAAGASDYQCDLLWRGLQSKVTCVQWHPLHRSLLAYGMEDGRIGVYDVQTKKYNHFRTSHAHEIKQLQWIVARAKQPGATSDVDGSFLESIKQLEAAQAQGQTLEDALVVQEGQTGKNRNGDEVKIILWSRDAAGHVLESNADAIDQNSREVMAGCTALALDDHSELLAVGLSNGVVKVKNWRKAYDDNSIETNRFHEHSESVTCLTWSRGPNAGLLASGGQDGKIFIYSSAKSTAMAADDEAIETNQQLQLLGGMEAHSSNVTGLSWCTDGSRELLASCSADGSVQVWNAATLEREAFFNDHVGRVLSIDWVSACTLATGGEDQTLRLWDYRDQQKDPPSNQKKYGKVKQPKEVDMHTGKSREVPPVQTEKQNVIGTDTSVRSSSAGIPDTTKTKSRKKNMMIFHPETKLTPVEIASACGKITEAEDAEDDTETRYGAKANERENNFLTRTDRGSVRDFFASEAKRYHDEHEWESLANMLLLQGKVADALRIVAKEGALSATWLSYAPMAGTDVWREMANLYAHQLDAQGDKKAAAFHFLSIDKVRSAIACLVSGDAHKEALALIRSRLGPQDPRLHDTLWKYSEVLTKRGHHGEAALALLQIGSVKAKTRAVHTLVNTGDMILVKSALQLLIHAAHTPVEGGTDLDKDNGEFSFPASLFISIAGSALASSRFDIAETAGDLLNSRLVATSSRTPYRLTCCLLKILKSVNEHQPSNCKSDEAEDEAVNTLLRCLPPSHREFFEFLTKPREDREENDADRLYDSVLCRYATAIYQEKQLSKQQVKCHGAHFWFQVLNACQESGYWFDSEGQSHIQEAQDLLVESNCFGDIEEAATACAKEGPNGAISCLLQTAQQLLRFVVDIMNSSFIGALEHMRAAFLLLAQSDMRKSVEDDGSPSSVSETGIGDFRVDVMLLLWPLGFASTKELPQCGELLDEHLDTLVLLSSVLLSQCHIVLAAFIKSVSAEDNTCALLIGSLLRLLRTQFLDDEATLPLSQGLMDPLNQSQLESLLNEMTVIVHQLPDKLAEENVDFCADEAADQAKRLSVKQALVDDVNDVRSSLSWSADGVKETF